MTVGKTVVVLAKDTLGAPLPEDEDLGFELLSKFLHALESRAGEIEALCFMTEGVRLLTKGSLLVEPLRLLSGLGIRLVACTTCLDYYGLLEQLEVGEKGTMNDIVELMTRADRVLFI
jgi:hypothetical protein